MIFPARCAPGLCLLSCLTGSGQALTPGQSGIRGPDSPPAPLETVEQTAPEVSVRLDSAPLRDFFRIMSEVSGQNLVVDPDVTGSITLRVDRVPWPELLETVLSSYRLAAIPSGSLKRIATRKTFLTVMEAERARRRQKESEMPLKRVSYRLNYADSKAVMEDLQRTKGLLSPQATLIANERTNTLFIREVEHRMAGLKHFLEEIDVPEPQVEIEARIVEVTTSFAREIGLAFGLAGGRENGRYRGGVHFEARAPSPTLMGSFSAGRLIDTLRLDTILSAGESRGRARVLSRPRITAQNRVEAVMTQGSRIPIPARGNFSASVRFETAALRLTVTPHITPRQTVLLKLKLENNFPDFNKTVNGIPTILTSEAETQVLVPDGGTTAIGGILLEVDRDATDQVPGLGRIPLLGPVFRRNAKENETREILFFLTSRITRFQEIVRPPASFRE